MGGLYIEGPWLLSGEVASLINPLATRAIIGEDPTAIAADVLLQVSGYTPTGVNAAAMNVAATGQANVTASLFVGRDRTGALGVGERIANLAVRIVGDVGDAVGAGMDGLVFQPPDLNGSTAGAAAVVIQGDPTGAPPVEQYGVAMVGFDNDLNFTTQGLAAGFDSPGIGLTTGDSLAGQDSGRILFQTGNSDTQAGNIDFRPGIDTAATNHGSVRIFSSAIAQLPFEISAFAGQTQILTGWNDAAGDRGLEVDETAALRALQDGSGGANSDSRNIFWRGETITATRDIGAFVEVDVGVDQYRWVLDDDFRGTIADFEMRAGIGSIWRFNSTGLRLRDTNDVEILSAAFDTLFALQNITSIDFTQRPLTAGTQSTMFVARAGAGTALTAGAEQIQAQIDLSSTTEFASGALATQRGVVVNAPTYAFVAPASTITDTATFAITGAPIAGANATLTNSYSLWVQSGSSFFADSFAGTAGDQSTVEALSSVTSGAHSGTHAAYSAFTTIEGASTSSGESLAFGGISFHQSTGANTGSLHGVFGSAGGGGSAVVLGAMADANGVTGFVEYDTDDVPTSGTITDGAALNANSPEGLSAARQVTTLRGVRIRNQGVTGVTNAIGVDVEAQSGASGLNLGARFASRVHIADGVALSYGDDATPDYTTLFDTGSNELRFDMAVATGGYVYQLGTDSGATDLTVRNDSGDDLFRFIGTGNFVASAASVFQIDNDNGSNTQLLVRNFRNAAGQVLFDAQFARGTSATPLIVADGDEILNIISRGYDGAAFRNAAAIVTEVDGTPAAGDMPGRIILFTTPAGTTTALERLRLSQDGIETLTSHTAFAGSGAQRQTGAVQTIDGTANVVALAFTLEDDTVYTFKAVITGRDEAGVERASYIRTVQCYREAAGGATLGAAGIQNDFDDETAAGLNGTFTTSGNDIRVAVTGLAGTDMNWAVTLEYQGISESL